MGMGKRERKRVVALWRCFGARALGMETEVDVLGGEGRWWWSNIKKGERERALQLPVKWMDG